MVVEDMVEAVMVEEVDMVVVGDMVVDMEEEVME